MKSAKCSFQILGIDLRDCACVIIIAIIIFVIFIN